MRTIIFWVILLPAYTSYAQEAKKENLPCSCSSTINVKYPDIAEEDELEGTVIIEYEIDSACFASDPKIIQSLGPEYDKEAIKAVNLMIADNNKCTLRCKFSNCTKRKVKFPLSFRSG